MTAIIPRISVFITAVCRILKCQLLGMVHLYDKHCLFVQVLLQCLCKKIGMHNVLRATSFSLTQCNKECIINNLCNTKFLVLFLCHITVIQNYTCTLVMARLLLASISFVYRVI